MSSIDDVQPTNYTDNWQEELQEENETLQKDNEEFGYSFNDEQIMKNEYLLENDIRPTELWRLAIYVRKCRTRSHCESLNHHHWLEHYIKRIPMGNN